MVYPLSHGASLFLRQDSGSTPPPELFFPTRTHQLGRILPSPYAGRPFITLLFTFIQLGVPFEQIRAVPALASLWIATLTSMK
jgi:hypothetical protein